MANKSALILAPRIDENDLRKTQKRTEDAMRRAAERSGREWRDNLRTGIQAGASDGAAYMSNKMKAAALAIAAAAGAAVQDSFGGAGDIADRLTQKAQTINDLMMQAQIFGFKPEEYAALSIGAGSKGVDADDLRGMLAGFVGAIEGYDEMSEFQQVARTQGIGKSFLAFLETVSKMDHVEGMEILNAMLGDEDSLLAAKLIEPIRGLTQKSIKITTEAIAESWMGQDMDFSRMGDSLQKSAASAAKDARLRAEEAYKSILSPLTETQVDLMDALRDKQIELTRASTNALYQKVVAEMAIIDARLAILRETRDRTNEIVFSQDLPQALRSLDAAYSKDIITFDSDGKPSVNWDVGREAWDATNGAIISGSKALWQWITKDRDTGSDFYTEYVKWRDSSLQQVESKTGAKK